MPGDRPVIRPMNRRNARYQACMRRNARAVFLGSEIQPRCRRRPGASIGSCGGSPTRRATIAWMRAVLATLHIRAEARREGLTFLLWREGSDLHRTVARSVAVFESLFAQERTAYDLGAIGTSRCSAM